MAVNGFSHVFFPCFPPMLFWSFRQLVNGRKWPSKRCVVDMVQEFCPMPACSGPSMRSRPEPWNFFLLYHNVNICMYAYIYIFLHILHILHILHTYTYIYIHIHTYTYIHTHTYTYIHTHTYIYIHIHTYTYIYIHIHTYTYIYIHIHTYIYIHTYTYIYIHIHTYTYIHAYIHTYTYTYIHIHTYTYIYIYIHIHTYTYIYIHIHTYTYIYIYIHIHTYTYIYIHIHTYTYIYIHIHIHTFTYIYIHIHTYTYIYIHIHTYTYIYIHIHTYTSRRVVYRTRVFNVCSVRHWFYTTNHSGFASLSKFNFLKKYARTFHWICKKPQRHSLFSALSVLHNFCSELGEVFVGTVFPSPLPSANMRPNLAIEQD